MISADLFAARSRLSEVEESLACGGLARPDELARLWLLEGALATFSGDTQSAADAFRAAAEVEPGRFIEDLGPQIRAAYEAALAERSTGLGTLFVEPTLAGWTLAIDGTPTTSPIATPEGLHVVQVGPTPDEVVFARVIHAIADLTIVIETGLEPVLLRDPPQTNPRTTPDAVIVPKPRPEPPLTVAWLASAGLGLGVGERLDHPLGTEPALKPVVPLETGIRLGFQDGWVRAACGAGPLLTGRYLYTSEDQPRTSPVWLGGHLGGGWASEDLSAGALVSLQWPGRIGLRGLAALPLGDLPLELEGRAGLNVTTARAPEGALELLVTFATDRL